MRDKYFKLFIDESKKIHGDKYDYSLVDYKNNKTKVKIICPLHGVFEQLPISHKKCGCKKCYIENKRIKWRDVLNNFIQIHGDKYDYSLVNYKDNSTKITIICHRHGVFDQTPKIHKKGSGCPRCSKNYFDGEEKLVNKFNKIHNNKYDYSNMVYKNDMSKIDIICRSHGLFSQIVNNHLNGKGCPKCGKHKTKIKQRLSKEEFIEKSINIHGSKYNYSLVDYINNSTKVKIKCDKHGYFYQIPKNHLLGKGCSKCNFSKGEMKIENYLKKNNIKYVIQKQFEDLKSDKDKFLRFDFFLPNINTCIEYNGKQHYEPIDRFGGVDSYKRRIYLDNEKKKYCNKNDINLITISYLNENNIPKILENNGL